MRNVIKLIEMNVTNRYLFLTSDSSTFNGDPNNTELYYLDLKIICSCHKSLKNWNIPQSTALKSTHWKVTSDRGNFARCGIRRSSSVGNRFETDVWWRRGNFMLTEPWSRSLCTFYVRKANFRCSGKLGRLILFPISDLSKGTSIKPLLSSGELSTMLILNVFQIKWENWDKKLSATINLNDSWFYFGGLWNITVIFMVD